MGGFTSYDSILNALSVLNKGQEVMFSKVAPTAQVVNNFHTSWAYTGFPGVGGWVGSGGVGAATMVSCNNLTTGAMQISSPTTASATNPYLLTAGAMSTTTMNGVLVLIDRLADTGILTTTSGGTCTITMPTGGVWERYPDGAGVQATVEVLSGTPSSGSTITLASYTNSAGTTTRASSASAATTTTPLHRMYGTGSAMNIALQGQDLGIRSIQTLSMAGATGANLALVVYKPLLILPVTTAYFYTERDLVIQTPKLPKLQVSAQTVDTSACLQWVFYPGAATTPTYTGSLSFVVG